MANAAQQQPPQQYLFLLHHRTAWPRCRDSMINNHNRASGSSESTEYDDEDSHSS
jgi:hypothetical protein